MAIDHDNDMVYKTINGHFILTVYNIIAGLHTGEDPCCLFMVLFCTRVFFKKKIYKRVFYPGNKRNIGTEVSVKLERGQLI